LTFFARWKQPSETGEELGLFEGLFEGEDVGLSVRVGQIISALLSHPISLGS
jgi:hypothetical protein